MNEELILKAIDEIIEDCKNKALILLDDCGDEYCDIIYDDPEFTDGTDTVARLEVLKIKVKKYFFDEKNQNNLF